MIVVPVYHTCADAERMATITGRPTTTVLLRNAGGRTLFPGVVHALPDKPNFNPTGLSPELAYLLYTQPEIGHTGRYGLWQLDSTGATTYVGPWEELGPTVSQRAVEVIHGGCRYGAGRVPGERVGGARPEFAMAYKTTPAGDSEEQPWLG